MSVDDDSTFNSIFMISALSHLKKNSITSKNPLREVKHCSKLCQDTETSRMNQQNVP